MCARLALLLIFVAIAAAGQFRGARYHYQGPDGEFDANDDDYDYKYTEVEIFKPKGGADLRAFASQVYGSYDRKNDIHYYEANKQSAFKRRQRGYSAENSLGRMISMQTYNRRRASLDRSCPQLTELYYVGKDGAQFLTPRQADMMSMTRKGWKRFSSMGMCVKSERPGVCGATLPLLAARRSRSRQGDDYWYSCDRNEYSGFLRSHKDYKKTEVDVLCYMWK